MAGESRKITERQREALRLVAQGYDSKQIGRMKGLSPFAIDKRLERAAKTMGAADRREAARMLMQDEGETYERIAYEPADVEIPVPDAIVAVSDSTAASGYPWLWFVSRHGRLLSKRDRLLWSLIGLPLLIMLVWGIFLSGVGALDVIKL